MKNKQVNTEVLSQRFGNYANYRKDVERSKKLFAERMEGAEVSKRENRPPANKTIGGEHKAKSTTQAAPPRLANAKPITQTQADRLAKYAPLIQRAAAKHNVPIELICGVVLQESNAKCRAKSPAGAQGLMQLMPATAKRFGVTNSYDPAQNIEGGTKYLRFLLDRFDNNVELALAGYNAGEGAVEKYGNKIPPYKETQNYVPKVLGYTQSMIDILLAQTEPKSSTDELPAHARRV